MTRYYLCVKTRNIMLIFASGATDTISFVNLCHVSVLRFQGVTSTIFKNQPSLHVVSNGADCLLLSKQFFTKHCSEKMLTRLKEQVCYMNTVDENHCKCDRLRVCVYLILYSTQIFCVVVVERVGLDAIEIPIM